MSARALTAIEHDLLSSDDYAAEVLQPFADSRQLLGNWDSDDVALGDLDGDGDTDAVVTDPCSDSTYWRNDGAGRFVPSETLGSNVSVDVALGDLDEDGDLDAFLANFRDTGSGGRIGEADAVFWNDTGSFSATVPDIFYVEDISEGKELSSGGSRYGVIWK
jgi:hypothetical protein